MRIEVNGVSETTGASAPQTCEGRAAVGMASPANLLKGHAERLADELMKARVDRDLAEAETRSPAEHHIELRAELLRLQTLVKAAAAGRRSLDADPREAALVGELTEARAELESELKRRRDMTSEMARLQVDLASTQSRLANAQIEIENLLLERDAIRSSRTWKLLSRLHRISTILRRRDGRLFASSEDPAGMDRSQIDDGKPTIVLLLAAAETEEARLGYDLVDEFKLTRNVVVVLQSGGRGEERLAASASALVGPLPTELVSDPREARAFARRLRRRYNPLYVLANGFQSQALAVALREAGIPLLTLVHGFLDGRFPNDLRRLYDLSDAVVFPTELLRRNSVEAYGLLQQRRTYVMPCGLIDRAAPKASVSGPSAPSPGVLDPIGAEVGGDRPAGGPFEVVGCGPADLQGGVDIFIGIAAAFKRAHPELVACFTWRLPAEGGPSGEIEALLKRQFASEGLPDLITFGRIGAAPLEEPIDAMVLCTRSYAIPTIEAQAAARGVPLLCLSGSVFADLLRADPLSSWLVAPSQDVAFVAEAIAELIVDTHRRARTSSAMRRLARRSFNMRAYARSLDVLGSACAERAEAAARQADHLVQAGVNLDGYFRSAAEPPQGKVEAARRYLDEVRGVDYTGPAVDEHHPRRASPGFHPFIYARTAPDYQADRDGDPLVHFMRSGRPAGPWTHGVIQLDDWRAPPSAAVPMRAAIHGHFHYTDNIDDFLQALAPNLSRVDVFLTTTGEAAADRLRQAVEAHAPGAVSVEIRPNVGRDIGPFIQLLGSSLHGYDVVGHVHGKRSIHTLDYDAEFGDRWRNFLWRQLIGPSPPAMDIVLAAFAQDPLLGLVFPENEQFIGWEKNRASAARLAPRLKLGTLPEHIEFPAGTMFWARPQALHALLEADFKPEDYPPEPLPDDGTMLHAIERLLPIIAHSAGFHYATTYHPGLTRLAEARA